MDDPSQQRDFAALMKHARSTMPAWRSLGLLVSIVGTGWGVAEYIGTKIVKATQVFDQVSFTLDSHKARIDRVETAQEEINRLLHEQATGIVEVAKAISKLQGYNDGRRGDVVLPRPTQN